MLKRKKKRRRIERLRSVILLMVFSVFPQHCMLHKFFIFRYSNTAGGSKTARNTEAISTSENEI